MVIVNGDFEKLNLLRRLEELDKGSGSAMYAFEELQAIAHDTAILKGWWNPAKSFGEQVLMMHSELSEAVEEYRVGHEPNEIYFKEDEYGLMKPEGVAIELADCEIRIMDTAQYNGIDLFNAKMLKMRYNLTRSHRHGGKKI